mgnify:CR=1 FL=1
MKKNPKYGSKEPRIIARADHNVTRAEFSKSALKVLYRLNQAGYEAFLVGGCVRDALLGEGVIIRPIPPNHMSMCPPLVITDEQMPEMSGLEFCRHYRSTDAGREVPIILLTAKKLELDAAKISRELQIGLILGKPFSPKAIVRKVTGLLDENLQSVPG